MGSLDVSFGGFNYGKLEGFILGDSLRSIDGKVLGSDEDIKLVLSEGKLIVTILGDLDVIILGLDVGTDLGAYVGYFYDTHYGKLEGLLLGESMSST